MFFRSKFVKQESIHHFMESADMNEDGNVDLEEYKTFAQKVLFQLLVQISSQFDLFQRFGVIFCVLNVS